MDLFVDMPVTAEPIVILQTVPDSIESILRGAVNRTLIHKGHHCFV